MSNESTDAQAPTADTPQGGPLTVDQLIAQGWDREQAEYLCAFDAVLEGRDATLILPVTLHALENVASYLAPEAMRQVAQLFIQAGGRIADRADEKDPPHGQTLEEQLQVVQQLPRTLN